MKPIKKLTVTELLFKWQFHFASSFLVRIKATEIELQRAVQMTALSWKLGKSIQFWTSYKSKTV